MTPQEQLQQWIADSDNIVFFGGAGVSTESGIPDFRSVDGLYNQKYDQPPETILSHTYFQTRTEDFYRFYRDKMLWPEAVPNAAHRKLAELAQAAGIAPPETPAPEAAASFIQAIRAMNARFGIGATIPELRRADVPALARHADKEANPLYPVPLLLDADELAPLFERLLDEA